MPSGLGSTLIKLAVGCLVVGLLLNFFDVSPRGFLEGLGGTALEIFDILSGLLEWAVKYILLGAIVVIPIWLIIVLWRVARKKAKG